MNTVEILANRSAQQKAEDALAHLDQAWAYYEPEPQKAAQDDKPAEGFVPYYDAA